MSDFLGYHLSVKRRLWTASVMLVVALLFAPKSGAQTRKDIRSFSKKTVSQLDDC